MKRSFPRVFVVGEVFPEGGVVIRYEVPLPCEAEGCGAGTVSKDLVENTLEAPGAWGCLARRERRARELPTAPAAFVGQTNRQRNRNTCCSFFSLWKLAREKCSGGLCWRGHRAEEFHIGLGLGEATEQQLQGLND